MLDDPRPAGNENPSTMIETPLPSLLWEGPLFQGHSLALVNREICQRLHARHYDLAIMTTPGEGPLPEESSPWFPLAARLLASKSPRADIHVRHRWPPVFDRSGAGKLVIIQPWEFGSLPTEWIEPLNEHADEMWAYSTYVRDCYVRSGIDPDRVVVVPLGVDTARFHPDAPPLLLETRKSFRFLFVGGTIPRKGIDILLAAFTRTFSDQDDVCLVIKDMGGQSFYKGQTAEELVRRAQQGPKAPEILYLDTMLTDAQIPSLYTACQALVHPFRGEGFGLPMAEAMSCALPVIVTGSGPALDFCDEACGWLIPATEVTQTECRVGPFATVERPWRAEPDPEVLATTLRTVFELGPRARQRGWMARERIRTRFTWEHTVDRVENRLALLQSRDPVSSTPRSRTSLARLETPPAPSADDSEEGEVSRRRRVRWGASPFNYSGYARVSRMLLPALAADGFDIDLQSYGRDERFMRELLTDPKQRVFWRRLSEPKTPGGIYFCFHPAAAWDGHLFFETFRRQNPRFDAYVGITMFETDRLPRYWVKACERMDQVWVPSRFNLETFERAGIPKERLRLFQPGLDLSEFARRQEPFPIQGRKCFTFLSVFQWTLRKGWDVLLEAWARAFKRDDDVRLAIRAYPASQKLPPIRQRIKAHLKQLGTRQKECAPIVVIDDFVSEAQMPGLYQAADAFVLPSRGEGWGLPYMEAMASGLPTVGTNWSGQLDFMTKDNSYLLDVDGLEPVHPDQTRENPYYEPDHQWARPSVEHLVEILREIRNDPAGARALGERARSEIFESWGVARSVDQFRALTGELARGGASHRTPGLHRTPALPIVWQGPLHDASGYAEEGRNLVLALDEAGHSVAVRPVVWSSVRVELPENERRRLAQLESVPAYDSYIAVQHLFGRHLSISPRAAATIGRTMFETDRIPAGWVRRCNLMTEVWVPSRFNVETFASSGVHRERLFVVPGSLNSRDYVKVRQNRPPHARKTCFLSVFDWSLRKGWDVLLDAWRRAFTSQDDVSLHLKVSSSLGYTVDAMRRQVDEALHGGTNNDPAPVHLITDLHSAAALRELFAGADVYVMPSRGEGWGRPYMEAMACGTPVIGTGWSGNTEFMDTHNSHLIDHDVVPVPERALAEVPSFRGHHWAEPRAEHLVELLRRTASDKVLARKHARRGRKEILQRFDRPRVAETIASRLVAIGASAAF